MLSHGYVIIAITGLKKTVARDPGNGRNHRL